jgi:hypothetical protein
VRRYLIQADPTMRWTLVFAQASGSWHVEKLGLRSHCVRLSINEFERSDHGARLHEQLLAAVKQAELDL